MTTTVKPVFEKAAGFQGTKREYNQRVWSLASAFRYGIDGDGARGFEPGGVYRPIKIDDVRKAIAYNRREP